MADIPEYTLRPALDGDIEGLYALHVETMRGYVEATFGPWDEAHEREVYWRRWGDIQVATNRTLDVVLVGGAVAGYLDVEDEGEFVALNNIRVAPSMQGRGLGGALVQRVITEAAPRPVQLRVYKVNPAQRLYRRLGFREIEDIGTHYVMRTHSDGAAHSKASSIG
ncbi:MAG: GNAT family N-acetyltransferase [Chloroflexi bacterium]|nr:MAG: GNAT family N-acetyltransferase [Chloroflexota bacterium]